MPCFLETDIRERMQTSKQNISFSFLNKILCFYNWKSIFLRILRIQLPWLFFFLFRRILKEKEMSWQKPLRPISNASGNSNFPLFGKFQKCKPLTLYRGGNDFNYASVIFNFAFEKLCLHVNYVC